MSDPTFWTPPCSPKFVGESFSVVDDLANDLFQDEAFSGEVNKVIGLSCDALNVCNILRFFDSPPDPLLDIDLTASFGLLWSRFQLLRQARSSEESPVLKSARNDITILLLSVLKTVSSEKNENMDLSLVASQLRSLLISVCGMDSQRDYSRHWFHAKIELWIISMKLLECQCSYGRDIRTLNACFGLEPSSVLDAYGYFMDVLLDRMIHLYSARSGTADYCHCIDALWILLVRYTEKFQSGWFKHLHGKITKLLSHSKSMLHEPTSFERLRPNPVIQQCTESRSEFPNYEQNVWSVYWSLLAHTASVHRAYMNFSLQTEVPPASLQKYSIVIWLIRKLFLGEVLPSDKEVQVYLNCLLDLFAIWGPNLEVIRSLWIYFGRRLDYGFALTSEGRNSCSQNTRFASWFVELQKPPQSDLNAFHIFCHLLRRIPTSELPELMIILKVSLPTLTRQGAMRYLTLFGHLIFETLSKQSCDPTTTIHGFSSLVDALAETCQVSSTPEALHNWDMGRRCTTLHGIQLISLLCRHYCLQPDLKDIFCHLTDGLGQLAALQRLLRQSILESIKLSCSGSGPSRLSVMGWRSELTELCIRFGYELTEFDEEHFMGIGYPLVPLVTLFLDRSFFQSVRCPNDSDWLVFLKRLFFLANLSDTSAASARLKDYLWSDMFPVLKNCVSRSRDQSQLFTRNVVHNFADLALQFVKMCAAESGASGPDHERTMALFELFSADASVDPAVRFAFCEICYSTTASLKSTVSLFGTELFNNVEMAWRFFTIWLIYGLITRPACDDRANNQLGSSVQLTSVDAEILAFFAPDLAALFNEIDPEYTLISIAAKFDLCKSFHERMAYKSLAGRHLGRVCDVLCELFSISSLTDDQQAGLDATHIPNCSRETLCSIGFHAASLLIRHCAVLLYTPMVGDANGSSLEQVITAFFLPRQLYELSKFRSTSHLTNIEEGLLLSTLVIECMRDKLPDFTNGLSQLSWRSDTYVARIIRDSIRLYYKHLGGACIAMAVLNSPPDFRTHLLQLVVQEAVAEIGSNAQELDSQVMVQYVNKWLTFAKQIHRETHSAEAHQRDAPFIVWPLLNAFGSSNFCNRARSDVKQDARKLMTEYKQAVKNVKTVELREEIRRHCESLHQKSTKNTDLIHFFEI